MKLNIPGTIKLCFQKLQPCSHKSFSVLVIAAAEGIVVSLGDKKEPLLHSKIYTNVRSTLTEHFLEDILCCPYNVLQVQVVMSF